MHSTWPRAKPSPGVRGGHPPEHRRQADYELPPSLIFGPVLRRAYSSDDVLQSVLGHRFDQVMIEARLLALLSIFE